MQCVKVSAIISSSLSGIQKPYVFDFVLMGKEVNDNQVYLSKILLFNIAEKLAVLESIPVKFISFLLDGEYLKNEKNVDADVQTFSTIKDCVQYCAAVSCRNVPLLLSAQLACGGLLGGKGGFGAMLRIQAKQRGAKKTTDFGACRDLSGRRLRHINDEIILNKWKAARDSGKEFDVEQETATGIDLWFIGTPSWADSIKVDKRKRFMKPRLKTSICLDWLRARENRLAPAGAPPHWGCPRGRRCEFAHGEEELKGEMLKRWQQQQKDDAREQQEKKKEDYIGVLYRANKQEDELNDIISAGLKAEAANKRKNALLKKAKTEESSSSIVVERDSVDDADEELDYLQLLEADSVVAPPAADSIASASVSAAVIPSSSSAPAVESVVESNAFMEIVAGQFSVQADGEITSRCEFGSVVAKDFTFPESNYSYYEVELLTNGLMQIGWARKSKFEGSVSGGDGVGDDGHSWSFDGLRWRCWHFGQDAAYGPVSATAEGEKADGAAVGADEDGLDVESWSTKDIVGCAVQYSAAATGKNNKIDEVECCISFSLNGENFGPAFRFTLHRSKSEAHEPGMNWAMLSPALSLADGEKVRVNLGQNPFEYGPKGCSSHTAAPSSLPGNESNVVVSDETSLKVEQTEAEKAVEDVQPIDLESEAFAEICSLEALGLRKLQIELTRRGLKAGGSLSERAQRLLSVRGLAEDKVPKGLKAKKN